MNQGHGKRRALFVLQEFIGPTACQFPIIMTCSTGSSQHGKGPMECSVPTKSLPVTRLSLN